MTSLIIALAFMFGALALVLFFVFLNRLLTILRPRRRLPASDEEHHVSFGKDHVVFHVPHDR